MKEIYIIVTYTGTVLSKIIKLYTRKKYAHVSIAFDKNLETMYSFGRLNPYNPFKGGFVEEGKNKGTFKRFKNTTTKVFSMQITEEQYEGLKKDINQFMENKEKYKFNILGLFLTAINVELKRKNAFYCAEFVKYVIEKQGIKTNLPKIAKPNDFIKLDGLNELYEGKLSSYNVVELKEKLDVRS